MVIEKGCMVLHRPKEKAREGWAEASRKIAEAEDDQLVWPEFGNDSDRELLW